MLIRTLVMFHKLSIQIMQFVSLPEQSSPNRPLEHWQLPLIPQIPWPLHVVLGLQNANMYKWKECKSTSL